MRRATIAGIFTVATLMMLPSGVPANAVTTVALAGPGSYLSNYTTQVVVAQVGGELLFGSADAQWHDFVARDDYAPVQCPIEPGVCHPDTPSWCLPPDPTQPWTDQFGSNPLTYPAGECPLFWTPLLAPGDVLPGGRENPTLVLGTQYLTSGRSYIFYCSIHPFMTGTLVAV